ncbi:MAG: hypothetical protein ACO2ER_09735, partial [Castellaniella sp.]
TPTVAAATKGKERNVRRAITVRFLGWIRVFEPSDVTKICGKMRGRDRSNDAEQNGQSGIPAWKQSRQT